jgi:hypothetical protein
MYEPFPLTSAAYVERLSRSMKSGGLIVIESTADHIAVSDWSGRAKTRIVRMVAEKRLYH